MSQLIRRACFILAPLSMLPLLLINYNDQRLRCAYVIFLTSLFWMTEPIPLGGCSLLPIVLLPALGVLPADRTASCYMQEANMMFIATLTIAIAIVECNLHRRLALSGLLLFGTQPEYLTLGVLTVSCFLSIWVNNVAVVAMMVPVVERICDELFGDLLQTEEIKQKNEESNGTKKVSEVECVTLISHKDSVPKEIVAQAKRVRLCLFLSSMYGANIGAVTTITSAASNLVFTSIMDFLYTEAKTPVDYVSWMLFSLPITVVSTALSFVCIWLVFFYRRPKLPRKSDNLIRDQYKKLGKTSFAQYTVLILFLILVAFWLFRDPTFMRGWATYFTYRPKDSTIAVVVVLLLLVIPLEPRNLRGPSILRWEAVQGTLSWTVILLVGSNFALAEAAKHSGLSDWVSSHLHIFSSLNPKLVCFVLSLFTSLISEILANAGVVTIFVPIFAKLAESSGVNPLLYMITPTIASNFCFLLPVGTPANTIIYENAKVTIKDFFVPGVLVKLCTTLGCVVSIMVLSDPIFGTGEFPVWLEDFRNSTQLSSTI